MRRVTTVLAILVLVFVPLAVDAQRKSHERPSGKRMSETQQQNVDQLKSDAKEIKQGSQVTQEQKDALKNDLMSMAKGASKPDPTLVQKLANDLSQAMADGNITGKEKTQLMKDMESVMNSANISTEQVNKAISDAQTILTASGISKADVQTIANDMKAIVSEAQKNVQKAKGQMQEKASGAKARVQGRQ